ncbi:MAG: ATP-binding cassette domain-containing protein [Actinomycetia bacterium]|nr:ATP-binding cassette domain-containing protein [Actinomycetes bacterium]MCH9699892.1 ATP-binding cassette domain-containing protein [Actinomycetes bacterium]MCH9761386.1 ATP-binding cassette domain-containing protein [Actinomycetes bacterium]
MIEVVGVTRAFGAHRAVNDVTVSFPAGSITALLGLNGAGKTTMLRLMAGLDRPDQGAVTVCRRRHRCADPVTDWGGRGNPPVGLRSRVCGRIPAQWRLPAAFPAGPQRGVCDRPGHRIASSVGSERRTAVCVRTIHGDLPDRRR